MKKLLISSILSAGIAWMVSAGSAAATDVSLTIVSPTDGAVLNGAKVPVETRFVRGTAGDHLHVYVDGVFSKTTKRETMMLWDLADGEHTIEVRAASREKDEKGVEHKELGVNARVTVVVSAKSAERAPADSGAGR